VTQVCDADRERPIPLAVRPVAEFINTVTAENVTENVTENVPNLQACGVTSTPSRSFSRATVRGEQSALPHPAFLVPQADPLAAAQRPRGSRQMSASTCLPERAPKHTIYASVPNLTPGGGCWR
jgi:hypothetical protein